MLHAHVPRNLRVRASIQLGSTTRVPARAFLISVGLVFAGVVLIVMGANIERTMYGDGALILLSLGVFELKIWGRSTYRVAHILVRHFRRPRTMRLMPVYIALPNERPIVATGRRPRWQTQE